MLASIALCGAAHAQSDAAVRDTARVIVKFKADAPIARQTATSATEEHRRRAKALGDRIGLTLRAGRGVAERTQVVMASGVTSAELARRLKRQRDVDYAVVDVRRHRLTAPNDPLYANGVPGSGPTVGQWYLRAPSGEVKSSIDVEPAWDITTGSPGVVVAVLDTGVLYDHPDLLSVSVGGKLLPGYDMIHDLDVSNDGNARDADASDPGDFITELEANNPSGPLYQCTDLDPATDKYVAQDSSWHGTQVSGIIAAMTNNGVGMAGIGPAIRVMPVRVLGKCGGFDSDIIAGMRWAAGLTVPGLPSTVTPARVINLSLGGAGPCESAYQDAIPEILAAGTAVVAAAGNTAGHAVGAPGNCPGIITVAALRHVGTKVGFSDLGLDIAISAPGGNCVNISPGSPCLYPILTTSNSGTTTPEAPIYTDAFNASLGTSFSAPLVSGTVALMMSAQPTLTPVQARLVLQATARPFPTTGGDNGDGTVVPQCEVPKYDATGQPVDIGQCYCTVNTCGAGMLDAGAAVRAAATGVPPPGVQASGLWWDLADKESGWGINIAHQGDIIFLTWYTYDQSGNSWWLSMTAYKSAGSPDVYSGQLIASHGPAFSATPFNPAQVTRTTVGNGTLRFADLENATFTYTVNGLTQTKPIARFPFGPLPVCTFGAQPNFAAATNYQDLWWVGNGAESGWGINLAHQGDIIFGSWYTYDVDGSPLWLSVTALKVSQGVYSGQLIRVSGPPFGSTPFNSAAVIRTVVGTATFSFANGNAATFNYVVNGVAQSKAITRFLFLPPSGTICQ
ncbi:MAG: S8 family peptidase [Betaproteobacteria bacterium]